jgi:hypothetical protein
MSLIAMTMEWYMFYCKKILNILETNVRGESNANRHLYKIYNDCNCRALVAIALKGTAIIPIATAQSSGVQKI